MGVAALKHKLLNPGLAHERLFRVYSHSGVDSDLVYTYTTSNLLRVCLLQARLALPSHTHKHKPLRLRLPVNDFI